MSTEYFQRRQNNLKEKIAKENSYNISISHTTRKPRTDEIDGQDYFFVSQEKFKNLPLRKGVGIIVLNKKNEVFVAKRIDNKNNFYIYRLHLNPKNL